MSLEVTNIGRRTATISGLYWKARSFGKDEASWIAPQNDFSSGFPVTLADGDTARWMLPIEEFDTNFADMARDNARMFGLFTVRAGVETTTGARFSTRVRKTLRDHLGELARQSPPA